MSKIGDLIIQAEEDLNNDERLAQYRQRLEEYHRTQEMMENLQKKWEPIYKGVKNASRNSR